MGFSHIYKQSTKKHLKRLIRFKKKKSVRFDSERQQDRKREEALTVGLARLSEGWIIALGYADD